MHASKKGFTFRRSSGSIEIGKNHQTTTQNRVDTSIITNKKQCTFVSPVVRGSSKENATKSLSFFDKRVRPKAPPVQIGSIDLTTDIQEHSTATSTNQNFWTSNNDIDKPNILLNVEAEENYDFSDAIDSDTELFKPKNYSAKIVESNFKNNRRSSLSLQKSSEKSVVATLNDELKEKSKVRWRSNDPLKVSTSQDYRYLNDMTTSKLIQNNKVPDTLNKYSVRPAENIFENVAKTFSDKKQDTFTNKHNNKDSLLRFQNIPSNNVKDVVHQNFVPVSHVVPDTQVFEESETRPVNPWSVNENKKDQKLQPEMDMDEIDFLDNTSFNIDTEEEMLFGMASETDLNEDLLPPSPPMLSQNRFSGETKKVQQSSSSNEVSELKSKLSAIEKQKAECMKQWKSLLSQEEVLEKRLISITTKTGVPSTTSSPEWLSKFDDFLTTATSSSSYANSKQVSPLSNTKKKLPKSNFSTPDIISLVPDIGSKNSQVIKKPKKIPVVETEEHRRHPRFKLVKEKLSSSFGLRTFRENQLDTILSALDGIDCFVLMPTGGGKSLCYQLTALVNNGVTIVVSPLRSLISDQVQKLKSLRIAAAHLSSDVTATAEQRIYVDLHKMQPDLKLLYVTPEKLSISSKLISAIQNMYNRNILDRFIIDEAHCISQWGHDFRPDYKKLNQLRCKFPNVPFMALTATATPRVQTDILNQLRMKTPKTLIQSFNRSNLQYFVLAKSKKTLAEMATKIKTDFCNKSGIIYCYSRRECDSIAQYCQASGISAAAYHAGLTDKQRNNVHENWLKNSFKVVCATIAFGMGIDKPDVRFVFHNTIPKSVEGYFQESGRAGRDGRKSVCILYYQYSDMYKIRRMIDSDKDVNQETRKVHMDNLFRVVQYCENKVDCRRSQQLHYFGERDFDSTECKDNKNTTCDNCTLSEEIQRVDVTEDSKKICRAINEICHGGNMNYRQPLRNSSNRITICQCVDIFKGSQSAKVKVYERSSLYNLGSLYQRNDAERLFRHLVLIRVLSEELVVGNHENVISYLKLGPRTTELLSDKFQVYLNVLKKKKTSSETAKKRKSVVVDNADLIRLKEECFDALSELRTEVANHNNLSNPETIVGINVLHTLSEKLPSTQTEMIGCLGVTENWFHMWGEEFLQVTQSFSQKAADLNPTVTLPELKNYAYCEPTDVSSPYFESEETGYEYDYEDPIIDARRGGRGGKRGRGKKRFKRTQKSQKKTYATNSKGSSGGWPPAWSGSDSGSNSGWKSTTKLGLMAPPKAKRPRI